jgi:hypothetical protein
VLLNFWFLPEINSTSGQLLWGLEISLSIFRTRINLTAFPHPHLDLLKGVSTGIDNERPFHRTITSRYLEFKYEQQTFYTNFSLSRRYFRRNGRELSSVLLSIPSFILPINLCSSYQVHIIHASTNCSDNGGSSSEISRILGGPGIGDIRSRLIRLMSDTTPQQSDIKNLLSHRLCADDDTTARTEWLEIVEGTHTYTSFRLIN